MKTLFVWLLLVALPFQGHAAAAPNFCASSSAPAPRTGEHCHAVGAMIVTPGAHASAQGGRDDAQNDQGKTASTAKCGQCNTCTTGATVMPAFPELLLLEPGATEPIAYTPLYSSNPLAAGLERPPHRLQA